MDAHPTNALIRWLTLEAGSIAVDEEPPMERTTDISDLKRRIAAGEYSLDAGAIAEAMFGRADRDVARESSDSEVLEAGEGHAGPGGVDEL
jgi:hypothetical protein